MPRLTDEIEFDVIKSDSKIHFFKEDKLLGKENFSTFIKLKEMLAGDDFNPSLEPGEFCFLSNNIDVRNFVISKVKNTFFSFCQKSNDKKDLYIGRASGSNEINTFEALPKYGIELSIQEFLRVLSEKPVFLPRIAGYEVATTIFSDKFKVGCKLFDSNHLEEIITHIKYAY